jgi:DNA-binding NtrC family response regulator
MAQHLPVTTRILLVEDDEDLCEAARIGLERQGYQVHGFLDPTAARAAFEHAPASWDLLITDQNMPDLTGLELIRIVKTARFDLPVILWTGMGHVVSEETARAHGAALYLRKPADNAALVQAVRKILGEQA